MDGWMDGCICACVRVCVYACLRPMPATTKDAVARLRRAGLIDKRTNARGEVR